MKTSKVIKQILQIRVQIQVIKVHKIYYAELNENKCWIMHNIFIIKKIIIIFMRNIFCALGACTGLSGEESDVLSINADMNDSDIEGHKDPKSKEEEVPPPTVTPPSSSVPPPEPDLQSDEPKLELQRDIDKSVSEILALTNPSSDKAELKLRLQPVTMEAAPASFPVPAAAPSAQQLALLELEMRARAIKALMKANEVKK